MYSKRFEKETFKEAVRENVRTLYRKNIAEASPQQIFQAVSYAVKDIIMPIELIVGSLGSILFILLLLYRLKNGRKAIRLGKGGTGHGQCGA